MWLCESKQRRADGNTVAHLQLAKDVWNTEKHRSKARILCNCGPADDPDTTERLCRLAHYILRRCSAEERRAHEPMLCTPPSTGGFGEATSATWVSGWGRDASVEGSKSMAGSRLRVHTEMEII